MKVNKIKISKINQIDFDNLDFGSVFTDHMFTCDYINGEWVDPQICPYEPITISPSARVFHYGQACFEGMKAFKDNKNKTWLFRPNDNYERIIKSSVRLAMPEFPKELFFESLNKLLELDNAWIKNGEDIIKASANEWYVPTEAELTQWRAGAIGAWLDAKGTFEPDVARRVLLEQGMDSFVAQLEEAGAL